MTAQVQNTQRTDHAIENEVSGVSWGAIMAGATGAAALSMVFLVLGVGMGFSVVSPWQGHGISIKALGVSAIIWLAFTQIAASGLGGYLAGRLRVKWTNIHRDEMHFRDTAHGLLAWSIASLLVAVILATGLASIASKSLDAGASVVAGATRAASDTMSNNAPAGENALSYYVDSMFRSSVALPHNPSAAATGTEITEVAGIFANALKVGVLSLEDRAYLGMVVSRHTGLSPVEANARVNMIYSRASRAASDAIASTQQAADSARKTMAHTALWMVVTLFCGAFVASLAALWGGKERDHAVVPVHKPLGLSR